MLQMTCSAVSSMAPCFRMLIVVMLFAVNLGENSSCDQEACETSLLQLHRGCSAVGENCESTACCRETGYKCYEKDQYWAGCRASCEAGQVDPNDPPEWQTPWTCVLVGCSSDQEDCRSTGCCKDESKTCYEKDENWAGCRQDCQPGEVNPNDPPEYRTPWSCHVIGPTTLKTTASTTPKTSTRTTSTTERRTTTRRTTTEITTTTTTTRLTTLPETTTLPAETCLDGPGTCSAPGEDCRSTGCCLDPSYTCYRKDEYWASCRRSCSPGEIDPHDPPDHQTPWSCEPVNPPSPAPSPPPPFPGDVFVTASAGSGLRRVYEFVQALTQQPVEGSNARAVLSSGGAAGGVVSEGQGYGVLLTGSILAQLAPEDDDYHQISTYFYELFLGWRRMCELSTENNCQEDVGLLCGGAPCLPHWKFGNDLTTVLAMGSAPDGDEDAITGMLLAVMALEKHMEKPSWLDEVGKWGYESCKQFYLSETIASSSGRNRIVKLGACWGGWGEAGQNPSYHAPGAYRLCRDYMKTHEKYGEPGEGASFVDKWNLVISTTYKFFNATQCHSNGLISNWARVWETEGEDFRADTEFSGSGTPSAQYGSEAARTTWRVALDYMLFPEEAQGDAEAYLEPLIVMLETREHDCQWDSTLRVDGGCLVTSVHPDWSWNMFIAGPSFSSFVSPSSLSRHRQQELINAGGARLTKGTIQDYYGGSWVAIATATVNGDFIRAAAGAGLYAAHSSHLHSRHAR